MGTWGFNVLDNDTACDVHAEYIRLFNLNMTHAEIVAELFQLYAADLADEDSSPMVWLAMARAQWDCGAMEPRMLDRAREIIETGKMSNGWAQEGPQELARHREAMATFLAKLQTPNPRPRKPRRAIQRKPVFQPGDCLAIRLSDGDYGAALVLENPPEEVQPGEDTHGINLIALMDYKGAEKPGIEIFEQRRWIWLTRPYWKEERSVYNVFCQGFKSEKERFDVVAKIPLRPDDPRQEFYGIGSGSIRSPRFGSYTGWGFITQVLVANPTGVWQDDDDGNARPKWVNAMLKWVNKIVARMRSSKGEGK